MTGLNDFRNHPEPDPPRCACGHFSEDHGESESGKGACSFTPQWCACKQYRPDVHSPDHGTQT